MDRRRVVVTGVGTVNPTGNDTQESWANIRAGVHGITRVTRFDTKDYKFQVAGEVKNFTPQNRIDRKTLRHSGLFAQYALYAAAEAVESAGLDTGKPDDRTGVIVSSGIGGLIPIEENHKRGEERGYDRVSPFFIPMAISNMAAANIAIRYGFRGMCTCPVTACAGGSSAIGDAFHRIRDGYEDVMICGGAEAAITPLAMGGFSVMEALTSEADPDRASVPFDAERSGFVMGEGAGILVLEELEHARARKAEILAEITGYGANCDAYHITAPSPDGAGAAACMRLALKDSGIQPDDIDYINAHGTSTHLNDSLETTAVKAVFGADKAYKLPVSSTKSMTGHMLGAAGAVEAVFCVMALRDQFIPPTAGYRTPDPACDLDYVTEGGRSADLRYVMSDNLGFGGHNAVLIFRRAE